VTRGPVPLGTVKTVPIGDVHPAPDNPRKIPQAAVDIVAKSIAEFGWQQPLVVDADYEVIVGHTRLLAAKQLQLATVPIVVADHLTEDQVRAYRIADNRTGDFSSWDFSLLTVQLDELAADFSDVLALADWQTIVADLDEATAAAEDAPEGVVDALTSYMNAEHAITVVCDSEQTARTVAAAMIDMPGVIDVRNKR
jgi:rhodanese-related sulfurtransferase